VNELSLVTGGAGFIGSHLVHDLLGRGRPVRVLDDFSTGLRDNLAPLGAKLDVVEGSLTDPAAVAKAVRGAGVVYHLGALASVARSVENPAVTHAACATGTLNLLDAARKSGVRRVVYAASSSAYGGTSQPGGQTEDQLPAAKSPYAAAKLAGELYMRQRADSPYSGVIALFTAAMARGDAPTVQGDGRQSRDFTYVANAVQALVKAAEAPEVSGNVYNVGTGRSVTVLDLVAALNRILGTDLPPVFGPSRAGDVRFSQADVRRTRRDLGYEPAVSFEEGLRKTVAWYLEASGSFRQLAAV
jgi:UDP-glucose 4-epimerase